MRFLALLVVLLVLGGCAGREMRRQAAADAGAGADVLATSPGPEVAKPVAEGVKINAALAAGEVDASKLPPPTRSPEAIAKDPGGYLKGAKDAAVEYAKQTSWLAWAGGAGLFVLGLLRMVPGAHLPIVGVLQVLLENAADRATRKRKEDLAVAGSNMVAIIESLPPEATKPVRDAISRKLPSAANDAVKAVLDSLRRG